MFKAVVFDIGNVIWRFKPLRNRFLRRFASLNQLTFPQMKAIYVAHYRPLETNHRCLQDFVALLQNRHLPSYLKVLDSVYNSSEFDSFYLKRVVALSQKLRQKTPVAFLSNAENFFFPYIHQKIIHLFDFGSFSWQLGLRKPDPQIFHRFLSLNSLDPSQIILIDDKAVNVTTAESLGIQAIHFRSYPQLQKDLSSFITL